MVEDREVVVLVLGMLVLAFMIAHVRQLRRFPWWPLPFLAGGLMTTGWGISVIEHIVDFPFANLVEHGLYAAHSLLLCAWAYKLSVKGRSH